jgi:hypothetical protein
MASSRVIVPEAIVGLPAGSSLPRWRCFRRLIAAARLVSLAFSRGWGFHAYQPQNCRYGQVALAVLSSRLW